MCKPAGIAPARTEFDRRVIEAVAPGPADGPQGLAADGGSGAIFLCHNSSLAYHITQHPVCRDS